MDACAEDQARRRFDCVVLGLSNPPVHLHWFGAPGNVARVADLLGCVAAAARRRRPVGALHHGRPCRTADVGDWCRWRVRVACTGGIAEAAGVPHRGNGGPTGGRPAAVEWALPRGRTAGLLRSLTHNVTGTRGPCDRLY